MDFRPAVEPPRILSAEPRWFVCHPQGVLVLRGPDARLPGTAEVQSLGLDPAAADYLGTLGGDDCFAIGYDGPPGEALEVVGLRQLHGRIDDGTFAVAGRAVQIVHWAQTHRFCGRCAIPTVREPKERALRCPSCGLTAYPRLSPAIIVLVRRGAEALLARSGRFPIPFFSTLAGFVEVGETLEETLVREVREEVGVDVVRPRYFGSQAWPFPHSLMLGFTAEYAGGEIRVDGEEIVEARWFTADALPLVPPPLSIARKLIDAWVAEVSGG
jgi:NAD+ diphosphatase